MYYIINRMERHALGMIVYDNKINYTCMSLLFDHMQGEKQNSGKLFLKKPLPGMGRKLFGNTSRSFKEEYIIHCKNHFQQEYIIKREGEYILLCMPL